MPHDCTEPQEFKIGIWRAALDVAIAGRMRIDQLSLADVEIGLTHLFLAGFWITASLVSSLQVFHRQRAFVLLQRFLAIRLMGRAAINIQKFVSSVRHRIIRLGFVNNIAIKHGATNLVHFFKGDLAN